MDAKRFDALTRMLAGIASRRRALAGAAPLLLGGVTAILGLAEAGGKKGKKKCKRCGACQRCKKGTCKPKPNGTACGSAGQICQGGGCQCPEGEKDCQGACVPDTQCCPSDCNDDNACTTGFCVQGTCFYEMADNDSSCDGTGRCLNGVCNPRPTCTPQDGACSSNEECCGFGSTDIGVSCQVAGTGFQCRGVADRGQPCFEDNECTPLSSGCVGYICQDR
jgi:hypothetical protein